MNKPICVVSCPVDTFSGYGARSRDFIKALVAKKGEIWDIKILPQRWGSTPFGYIEKNQKEWSWLTPMFIQNMTAQPDYWFQITIPNEFQPVGKWNCGVTAGIETNACDISWVEGCNRMNLILTSSNHSKNVFLNTKYQSTSPDGQQVLSTMGVNTPVEVLFEGVNTEVYFKKNMEEAIPEGSVESQIDKIPEKFLFLVVGHWLQGGLGEDRKNIALTIRSFIETFKNTNTDVALLLKVSKGGASIIDRNAIQKNISDIRRSVPGTHPNIYLLHGEFEESEMNEIYNHPKVKAMVSLTKGEGFGRPLIEFSQTKKPIAVSAWSGYLDFLNSANTFFIGGKLQDIHPSAVVDKMLIGGSQWFSPDLGEVNRMWKSLHKDYKSFLEPAKIQAYKIKTEFNLNKMADLLDQLLSNAPEYKPLVLPNLPTLKLPELKKVEPITQ